MADLVTIAQVKERLTIAGTGHDTLLTSLVGQVSRKLGAVCKRRLDETTHTEYVTGSGLFDLQLKHGPLVSVTSVNEVEWNNGEQLTSIPAAEYQLRNQRSNYEKGRGWLRRVEGGV